MGGRGGGWGHPGSRHQLLVTSLVRQQQTREPPLFLFFSFLSSTHSGSLGITGSGRASITSCAAVGGPPPAAPLTSADLAARISISATCVTDRRGRRMANVCLSFHLLFSQSQNYFQPTWILLILLSFTFTFALLSL